MAGNPDLRVRTNLLSQVPASATKRPERLDLGEAFNFVSVVASNV